MSVKSLALLTFTEHCFLLIVGSDRWTLQVDALPIVLAPSRNRNVCPLSLPPDTTSILCEFRFVEATVMFLSITSIILNRVSPTLTMDFSVSDFLGTFTSFRCIPDLLPASYKKYLSLYFFIIACNLLIVLSFTWISQSVDLPMYTSLCFTSMLFPLFGPPFTTSNG